MALVSLVVVSHSRALAQGVVELAAQMAPAVSLVPAGGLDDGSLGTSFALVEAAIEEATAGGAAAVVLTDLGSAVLTAESVLEFLEPDVADRVALADAPLVEGAVAAAVAAEGGADLAGVLAAARSAAPVGEVAAGPARPAVPDDPHPADQVLSATVTVVNPMGLHARPAAELARAMAAYDATVTVDGVDAASVLALMTLAATEGRELRLTATGPQARAALDAAADLIASGFGEA